MKTNYVKTGLYSRYINLGFFVLMAALLLSSLVTGCKQKAVDNTPAAKIITINGDERIALHENASIEIPPNQNLTWGQIESQAMQKVFLMSVWDTDDYGTYEWRIGNENGEKLTAGYLINKSITVYAVTNYNKFNIVDNKIKLTDGKGYIGSEPKGKIIIPDGITEIDEGAFLDCTEIISVKFPKTITKIGNSAFWNCASLKNLDLSGCANLDAIGKEAFYFCQDLQKLDLSGCKGLTTIGKSSFYDCTNPLLCLDLSECTSFAKIEKEVFDSCSKVKLPESITTIEKWAFGYPGSPDFPPSGWPPSFCKKVLIKSGSNFDRIKQLVIDSGYPEDRIESY